MDTTKPASERFKEKLFEGRKAGKPFAAYWDECPDVNGNPGFSRGYRLYKFMQIIEKKAEQTPKKEERDIKESM
jgi:hypothetical protein